MQIMAVVGLLVLGLMEKANAQQFVTFSSAEGTGKYLSGGLLITVFEVMSLVDTNRTDTLRPEPVDFGASCASAWANKPPGPPRGFWN